MLRDRISAVRGIVAAIKTVLSRYQLLAACGASAEKSAHICHLQLPTALSTGAYLHKYGLVNLKIQFSPCSPCLYLVDI